MICRKEKEAVVKNKAYSASEKRAVKLVHNNLEH